MRKYYLDNLRSFMILLLFPVHTFMVWNDFGSKFYIWNGENKFLSMLIVLVNPWFMPILFVIAGMCARNALEKRSTGEFIRERFQKLLLPFFIGMILLVPIQTLYARKFFFDYRGGFIENYKYFFTHVTDFTGYDGGFTPGHLWFLLFLFVISLLSLLLHKRIPYGKVKDNISKMNICLILGLFVPVWLFYYVGNIGGFSLGKDLALYLIGFYILSNDCIVEKLERNMKWIAILWGISEIALGFAYYQWSFYGDLAVNVVGWLGVLVWLVLGKTYWNRETKVTKYFAKASFPIYILHQSILVVLAYYAGTVWDNTLLLVVGIMLGSFALTVLCYQLLRCVKLIKDWSICILM